MKFLYFSLKVKIKFLAKGCKIEFPFRNVDSVDRVKIGKSVSIQKDSWFSTSKGCKVVIGDRTRIGRHFICSGVGNSIEIGKDVLISERVFITESYHGFKDTKRPIIDQGNVSIGAVKIEDDCWIGIGACIMPNVTIGKHSIIGSNAVVTKDIPPFSVAAGVPAYVIKKYNMNTEKWEKV